MEVGAVVGLGEVHQFFDFEGAVHVVDTVEAKGFDGVVYVFVSDGVAIQNDMPGVIGVIGDGREEFELRVVILLGIGMDIVAQMENVVAFRCAIADCAARDEVVYVQ